MKLYRVKAEFCYGEDREAKRENQLAVLSLLNLKEQEEGWVVCNAETALRLQMEGYTGKYESDAITLIYEENHDTFTRQYEQLLKASLDRVVESATNMFNQKCQQEQPNIALHNVDNIMLLENECSDNLQDYLNRGWRILAIQPQPDQRRPDYILGRNGTQQKSALRSDDINF